MWEAGSTLEIVFIERWHEIASIVLFAGHLKSKRHYKKARKLKQATLLRVYQEKVVTVETTVTPMTSGGTKTWYCWQQALKLCDMIL